MRFNQIVSPLGLSVLAWWAGFVVTTSQGMAAEVELSAHDAITSEPSSTEANPARLMQVDGGSSQQRLAGTRSLIPARRIEAALSSQASVGEPSSSRVLTIPEAEATAVAEQALSSRAIAQPTVTPIPDPLPSGLRSPVTPEPTDNTGIPLQDWLITQAAATEDAAATLRAVQATMDLAQVTSVTQFIDVQPGDWAYEALSLLANSEAEGGLDCLEGYPDGSFRGDRPLSRYEFAAGLAACLDAIAPTNLDADQIARIDALQREFAVELANLRGRIDALEAGVSELEANQFSTTTRLNILSSWNLSQSFAGGDILAEGFPVPDSSPASRLPVRDPFTGEPIVDTVDSDPNLTFSHSTYFILSTSFSGQDLLTTILAAGNGNPPASVYTSAGFTSTYGVPYADSNPVTPLDPNDIGLFELKYSFPVTPDLQAVVGPRILPFRHFDINPYTNIVNGSSGLNFYQSTLAGNGLSGSGGLLEWTISPQFVLRAGYLARNDRSQRVFGDLNGPSDPNRGLFDSTNSILAELTFSPSPDTNFRFLYNRARLDAPPTSPPGFPPAPFLLQSLRGAVDDGFGGSLEDIISHNFVFNFDWTITPRFALFGRYSYSTSDIDPVNPLVEGGAVEVQAFQLGVAFPDLGRRGAMGTFSAVVPFDVVSGRRFLVGGYGDGGTQVDLLASYSFPLTDQISLVPMFFATINPNNFEDNPAVYSIILRTQFLF